MTDQGSSVRRVKCGLDQLLLERKREKKTLRDVSIWVLFIFRLECLITATHGFIWLSLSMRIILLECCDLFIWKAVQVVVQ